MRFSRFVAAEHRHVVISYPLAVDIFEVLTTAERAIAELVMSGHSNADIARLRNVSERTVANQVAAILKKTKARSRFELILNLQR